ncbi:DUF4292 domain-containing protein [Agriterribacter sp.]|uniref:DUF4292 domain-containing protein n=1 Tax=Agriterribacter sp. TaxID=2821509 RepID=UPI002C447498|nr:DUF4292 domain-containing protein [Agriterribacter sp.]HTN08491.1 DUF4292 domain-containing protein [Agriterribacter sp.]
MRFILTTLFFIAVLCSCRSSKKLQSAITKKDTVITALNNPAATDSARLVHETFEKIRGNYIQFETFSSKIKVQYKDSKQRNYDFNAFVRIQKDSIIWISINAAFGIEAFRVFITPDSVKVMDKLDKNVQYRSVEYIREIVQLPVDFFTLQNLIVGNPVYLDSTKVLMYKERETSVSLATMGNFFKQLLSLRKDDYAVLHSKLDDVDVGRSRTADFTYNDYITISGRLFSTGRKISVAEKTRLDVSLEYKQVEFDKPLSYPFNIPRNYSIQ